MSSACARGCADGLGDVEIGQPQALGRQAIDVGRLIAFGAGATQVGVAQVVAIHQHDIRPLDGLGRGLRPIAAQEAAEQAGRQDHHQAAQSVSFGPRLRARVLPLSWLHCRRIAIAASYPTGTGISPNSADGLRRERASRRPTLRPANPIGAWAWQLPPCARHNRTWGRLPASPRGAFLTPLSLTSLDWRIYTKKTTLDQYLQSWSPLVACLAAADAGLPWRAGRRMSQAG